MANEKRLIEANALCEFFQERFEYLRNASETPVPGGFVRVDAELQGGAIIAKEFLDKAKQAPTVDAVEVVHGRWEDNYGGKYANPRYRCSACKENSLYKFTLDELGNWRDKQALTNYCPNCGAKMDGDGNGNLSV